MESGDGDEGVVPVEDALGFRAGRAVDFAAKLLVVN